MKSRDSHRSTTSCDERMMPLTGIYNLEILPNIGKSRGCIGGVFVVLGFELRDFQDPDPAPPNM